MELFGFFRKKKETSESESVKERPDSISNDSLTLSADMSKISAFEESFMSEAGTGPAAEEGISLSNEEIRKGDRIIDTYEVVSDAVMGGMGSVWKVHHCSWNTDLAMKRPQPRFFAQGSEKRKANFIHECEAWINLGLHPNIVSCFYVREIGGVPTIFSEWMENGSLRNLIDSAALYDIPDATGDSQKALQQRLLDIAIQFARGLNYAHESKQHLIHRDVKPDNLLLSKDWQAKVADFGLAQARMALQHSSDEAKTQIRGYTPAYCSSEQLMGEPLSRRTDIYSWAVSVLEMYLGKRLWKSGAQVGEKCREYFSLTRVKMPDALKALLEECLAEKPEDRPQDFSIIEKKLCGIYQQVCQKAYCRKEPKTASATAGSLNNQALSYIDLGKDKEAEGLLRQAIEKDGSQFLYHYNYALLKWNQRKISDAAFLLYLKKNEDGSAVFYRTMDTLERIRGLWDRGEEAYSYSKEGERPCYLEPLLPVSKTSYDGRYQVEGYAQKDAYGEYCYGYRIKDLRTGETRDIRNTYEDYGISTVRDGFTYMHAHYYKGDKVFFAGPCSEIVVMEADVLWFFDAESGRLILSLPPVVDEDGDTWAYEVLGYTKSGVIEYINWEQRWKRWTVHAIHLNTDENLPYELAGIATVDARLEAERNMEKNYTEAVSCWEKGDVSGTYRALSRSLEDQVLTLHEPSLRLWSKLSAYYKRDSLVTVLLTEDEPTPVPQRNECEKDQVFSMTAERKNHTENGQTRLVLECREEMEYDTCNDMYEYTFYYTLNAQDVLSGEKYYKVEYLEIANEADWKPFSKDRYLGLTGDHLLWYAQEFAEEETIDFMEINRNSFSVNGTGRVHFALPGAYTLKNTKRGVDIGGFVFDDVFLDFRPLWNSDVIACRDHNYRLVYRYNTDNHAAP